MKKYLRTKMGQLPGDLSKKTKIRMLEGDTPIQVSPWQTINDKCAKSFKKDQLKKANRRLRHRGFNEND